MGDVMLLNEREVQTCLEYSLAPLLEKYSVYIKESQLTVLDKIMIKAVIIYQDHVFDLNTSFLIKYENKHICFYNIEGKIEYLFLQLNIIGVLQQILTDEHILFRGNSCYYEFDIPIEDIHLLEHQVEVILK